MEQTDIQPASDGAAFIDSHKQDDDEFFFDDTFIVLLVENKFFRIPLYRLKKESKFFADIFASPVLGDWKGSSRENPLDLTREATADEFKLVMKLVFQSDDHNEEKERSFTPTEWLTILRLSTVWGFTCCRKLAITYLKKRKSITTMQHVEWGRAYYVSDWVRQGYTSIVHGSAMIKDADADALGWTTAFKLSRLREFEMSKKYSEAKSQNSPKQSVSKSSFTAVARDQNKDPNGELEAQKLPSIEKTFEDEFNAIKAQEEDLRDPRSDTMSIHYKATTSSGFGWGSFVCSILGEDD